MESKRKTRKVRKAASVIPAPQPPVVSLLKSVDSKPLDPEILIRCNGELIDGLFHSDVWKEIVFPLLQESIAGVSGRFTNGRFYKGNLTGDRKSLEFLSGYQSALEEFHNHLHDFIVSRDKLISSRKAKEEEEKAPLINPFMEEE